MDKIHKGGFWVEQNNSGRNNPKVTVLMPSLNVVAYIRECMDSVLCQKLDSLEIICIDAGSTDGTLEILREYEQKDSRVRVLISERKSYGYQMNLGLAEAQGEYIGIVETDDLIPPEMYWDLYKVATDNHLDFVKADFYRFITDSGGNKELTLNSLSTDEEDYNKVFNPSETSSALRFTMNTWSGIYRREFLQQNHILHNETAGASFQDNGFWVQTFVFAKRAMILNKPYYLNRRDNPGSSVHSTEKVYAMNIEYDFIRDILMENPERWERFKDMYYYKKYHSYRFSLQRIGEEYKEEFMDRFSREFRRAMQKGELSESVFSVKEWNDIHILIRNPKEFRKIQENTQESQKRTLLRRIKKRIPQTLKNAIKKAIGRAG